MKQQNKLRAQADAAVEEAEKAVAATEAAAPFSSSVDGPLRAKNVDFVPGHGHGLYVMALQGAGHKALTTFRYF